MIKLKTLPEISIYLYEYLKFSHSRIVVYFEAIRDKRYLINTFPFLNEINYEIENSKDLLFPKYHIYTAKISPETMAISLELASFLLAFCKLTQPKTILDLGSGFSSFVFRQYAQTSNHSVQIWSVDDNEIWLRKTGHFLGKNLSFHHFVTWKEFYSKNVLQFDLILHDLGIMQTRLKTLPYVFKLVKSSGFVILDDMHLPNFEPQFKHIIKILGFELRSLRVFTKDTFRRFSSIAYTT